MKLKIIQELRLLREGQWKYKINLSDVWENNDDFGQSIIDDLEDEDDEVPDNFSKAIVKELKKHIKPLISIVGGQQISQFQNLCNSLETNSKTVKLFNHHLNHLYDWADENRIWISTIL